MRARPGTNRRSAAGHRLDPSTNECGPRYPRERLDRRTMVALLSAWRLPDSEWEAATSALTHNSNGRQAVQLRRAGRDGSARQRQGSPTGTMLIACTVD